MRVLIAEDEVATAKALKLLLEKSKYSVDIVHNGNDAWDYVSDEGQRNSDALIDASHIDIKSMGTFNMGDNDSGDDFRKGMRK